MLMKMNPTNLASIIERGAIQGRAGAHAELVALIVKRTQVIVIA
jgi:hypothetical protein